MSTIAAAFPYHLDPAGRTASVTGDDYVRQLLEQLLLTSPGERVNRPDFGCGLLGVVFEPAAALPDGLTATISASVMQWLADVLDLDAVDVALAETTLSVDIGYTVRRSGRRDSASFTVPVQR